MADARGGDEEVYHERQRQGARGQEGRSDIQMADARGGDEEVYHERQRLQLCLLHALNNLFQQKDAFTRPQLNALAHQLSSSSPHMFFSFTPHHNSLTGNYDVNVLMAALEGPPFPTNTNATNFNKKKLLWHDRRTPPAAIDLASPHLMGILLNTTVPRLWGLCTSRHWLALRNIRGVWYNLDSDLSAPHPFPDQQHLISFLDHAVAQGGEIFLVFNLH